MRLDVYLAQNNIVRSREAAKSLILSGAVNVNGVKAVKPSQTVYDGDNVIVTGDLSKYVSRGGLKLEKALSCFDISVEGLSCLDIGASTGGFTDCLLQNGARLVYALDVGHNQLDERLRSDSRVKCMEGVNIRDTATSDFSEEIDFICTDVSFISLKIIIPKIGELLSENGEAVLLIKPQFECGRADLGKNGIVRSQKVQVRVIKEVVAEAAANGLFAKGLDYSPISGGDGNIEFLICLSKSRTELADISPEATVSQAHKSIGG